MTGLYEVIENVISGDDITFLVRAEYIVALIYLEVFIFTATF